LAIRLPEHRAVTTAVASISLFMYLSLINTSIVENEDC
jgi:hypothetical protein